MRLDLVSFNVNRITLANETRISDGELRVDAGAVKDLVLSEDLFEDVQVHAVHPGDQVRILHALDVVEPRYKVSGSGQVFPGVPGPTAPRRRGPDPSAERDDSGHRRGGSAR